MAALLAALVVAAALVLVWTRVVQTLTEQIQRQPPIGQPRAIVWNDRVFTTDRQLKGYLESKGRSLTSWVSKHPSAFAVLQHTLPASAIATHPPTRSVTRTKPASTPKRAKPRASARPKPTAKSSERSAAARPSAASRSLADGAAGGGSGVSSTTFLVLGLIALETILFALAILPARLGPTFLRRFYAVPERRFGVLAGAFAILFGLLLSLYLS